MEQKQTKPPKYYTEATLLRAMETAGKQVDDEELRALMKENGIGRPSTRANIIETLFRRKYVRKERKNLVPTITGIQLIDTIQNDLLKSAELTGNWEKQLREIEAGSYDVRQFMTEMKQMVGGIVQEVKQTSGVQRIEVAEQPKKKASASKKASSKGPIVCPKCKKGNIVKGKAAYGCDKYNDGCNFVLPFTFNGKKLTDSQLQALLKKGKTGIIKNIEIDGASEQGILIFDKNLQVSFQKKEEAPLLCPKCKQGTMLKGKNAYGCSYFKSGCQTVVPFLNFGKKLTDKQIEAIIRKGRSPLIKGFENDRDGRLVLNKDFKLELIPN